MALVVKDRVKQTTTTTGTGSIVLNGNVSGFQTFAAALTDGDTTYYGIFEPSTNEYEVGLGTWTESTATLARTTVLESSNSGSAVSLTAQAEVFITQPAEKAVFQDSNGDVDLGGNKILFGNLYSTTGDLPSASTYHGMFAHVHGTGKAYYAHGGNWIELVNEDTSGNVSMGGNLTVTGDLTVNGTTTTVNTTNTVVTDSLIELANGTTGSPSNDAGIVIERGDSNNAFIGYDESADKFTVGTGTFTGASTGNLTISTGTLVANVEGNVTGNVTGNVSGSSGSTTGNAATATALATARNIGGVSFDGTANINLPGVNTSGNQDTSGNAATATALETGRTISLTGAVTGTSAAFDGSGNVSIATTATADPTLTLSGDVTGSATFTNLGNATLSTTIAANSVALGTDTTGNYVSGATGGTGVTISGSAGEGWSPTISIGQAVGTGNSPQFSNLYIDSTIYHTGDSDTYMQFHAANQWRVVTGNTEMLEVNDSTVQLGATLDVNGNNLDNVEDIYLRDKLYHDGDTDTYIGFSTNAINIYTGGTNSGVFNTSGLFLPDGSLAEDYDALSGTSPTCNVDNGGAFSLTMSGNTTFTFSGASSGYIQGFVLQLTGNGSTVTWPGSVKWAGGTAPDAPASGETDILVFHTRDGGTNWYGVLASDAAA